MKKRNEWRQEVRDTFERIREHTEPYDITVEGIEMTVLPNVFSPEYFTDSAWFATEVRDIVGQNSLLEIGTGTGIVGLFCAKNGAKVVATDINSDAVENAKLNFKNHDVEASVRLGNMYEPIKEDEKFDFIFWNHPFNNVEEPVEDILLRAGFDTNYESLRAYISGAKNHLKENGRLFLGSGNFADVETLEKIATDNDYRIEVLRHEKMPLSSLQEDVLRTKGDDKENEYIIYELIPSK